MTDKTTAPGFADHIIMLQFAAVRLKYTAGFQADKMALMTPPQELHQITSHGDRIVGIPGQISS
jgi:hypothetical protein